MKSINCDFSESSFRRNCRLTMYQMVRRLETMVTQHTLADFLLVLGLRLEVQLIFCWRKFPHSRWQMSTWFLKHFTQRTAEPFTRIQRVNIHSNVRLWFASEWRCESYTPNQTDHMAAKLICSNQFFHFWLISLNNNSFFHFNRLDLAQRAQKGEFHSEFNAFAVALENVPKCCQMSCYRGRSRFLWILYAIRREIGIVA